MSWGYLRETSEKAEHASLDKHTGICRTSLDEYLKVIYPNVTWVHNKGFGMHNGVKSEIRPDYKSDELKIVIEFDGKQHYSNPQNIRKDENKDAIYIAAGYKVIRIPYFIQLTRTVVYQLFGVDVKEELFSENVASMSIAEKNTPAFMCMEGIKRMAMEFKRCPEQYETNIKSLMAENDELLTGVSYLINEYEKLKNNQLQ